MLTKGITLSELCSRKVDESVVCGEGSMGGRGGAGTQTLCLG